MIPKIIHYCWFGGEELSDTAIKCINSWRKYCPNYEIKMWNEDNFNIEEYEYTKSAYYAKKFAFVSDFARYYIIEKYGGIYMDVDVELIKPLDDFLQYPLFLARQDDGQINPGLIIGGVKNHEFLIESINYYKSHEFNIKENIVTITTNLLKKRNFSSNDILEEKENIKVFSSEYFCPISYLTGELRISEKTISIHHFDGSWLTDKEKARHNILSKYIKIFGKKTGTFLWIIKYYIEDFGVLETIKKINKKIMGEKK